MDAFHTEEDTDYAIIDGLRSTTARIIATKKTASERNGQTAIVTLHNQLAMLGLHLDVDVPDVPLLAPQPPLSGHRLGSALQDYSDNLLPNGSRSTSKPDITFVFGDEDVVGDIRVCSNDTGCLIARDDGPIDYGWGNALPFGAIAGAAVASVEGVRAAIPNIANRLDGGRLESEAWKGTPSRYVCFDLARFLSEPNIQLGEVDIVSGGAITNGALYCLLRYPDLQARFRIIEPDQLEISNFNRYALATGNLLGLPKAMALEAASSDTIKIRGEIAELRESTADQFRPFASRLLVGVDDIPSRWLAQRAAPDAWLCVGSTSHDFALVSEHSPGYACAGCTHPKDEATVGTIPTISFVSLWAGLMQAMLLLGQSGKTGSRGVTMWPLGLENPRGIDIYEQAPSPRCPVKCHGSRAVRFES